jgi:type III pantothenate kinase
MSLEAPRSLLGKNTHDAMTSGFIHGHAAMIDGLLDRISTSWDTMELSVIATGELAEKILPFCSDRHPIRYEPFLPLIGLKLIHP